MEFRPSTIILRPPRLKASWFYFRRACGFLLLLIVSPATTRGHTVAARCSQCTAWNAPQAPFRIYEEFLLRRARMILAPSSSPEPKVTY